MDGVRPIRFHHRGLIVELDSTAPTRTVLEWLREDAHCTGTKEGCAEGDCGACTVVIGELAPDDTLALRAINACTAFVPTLDGKALLTVEDLAHEGTLHPVQQAMVDCHGSQCGFCTPGFVMSLFETYERHRAAGTRATRQQLADDLAGNLCRCTGYRPILDAGERMFDLPAKRLETAPIVEQLRALQNAPPLALEHDGQRFWAPRTLEALAQLREQQPQATLLAGATDVALWVTKQLRTLSDVVYLGEVNALKRIEVHDDGTLEIGAGVALEDAWRVLVQRWPQLHDHWLRFGSPPVRHAGTMGGNLANGSPIGDSAPVLIALNAQLLLRHGANTRTLPLDAFYVDYMQNRLEPGEFVQAIVVPPLDAHARLRAYKLSKRYDCDISALACGLVLTLDGDTVRDARFAFGGMAAIVKRAAHAEQAVIGRAWNQHAVDDAKAALAHDFTPLSDLRASAAYRMEAARRLLQRFWLETRANAPLEAQHVSVWATMSHAPLLP